MNSHTASRSLDNPTAEVAVVFDPDFGEQLRAIWPGRAVWIVSSPINEPIIEALWAECSNEETNVDTCITSFEARDGMRLEEHVLDILSDVEQHHAAFATTKPYRILNVIGSNLTPRITKELMRLGFDISITSIGFLATRSEEDAKQNYE